MTAVLIRGKFRHRDAETDAQEECHVKKVAEIGGCISKPRNT